MSDLTETVDTLLDEYGMERSEQARELAQSVAHLRD